METHGNIQFLKKEQEIGILEELYTLLNILKKLEI